MKLLKAHFLAPYCLHPFYRIPRQTSWAIDEQKKLQYRLKQAGFGIDLIEEWCSDKKSVGKTATMENRSRQEFPLCMAIVARKL